MEELRLKLDNESYMNVSFIVVNHQGEDARAKYNDLKIRVSENIPVYQQEEGQADIWSLLKGDRNDFLIYDRCGRLVKHIVLPFSFLEFNYVENAIKEVYCGSTCGECKYETPNDVCKKEEEIPTQAKTDEDQEEAPKHLHHHRRHNHPKQKETAAEDSNRPNVHVHKKHHHRHHKVEGCQTPLDRVAERNEPEGRVEGAPDRAVASNSDTQGQALENKL